MTILFLDNCDIAATTAVESRPPLRKAPIGTSAISRDRVARRNSDQTSSALSSIDTSEPDARLAAPQREPDECLAATQRGALTPGPQRSACKSQYRRIVARPAAKTSRCPAGNLRMPLKIVFGDGIKP